MPSMVVTLEPEACPASTVQDHAGAALAGIAADMGAGQVQIFAQEMDQQRAVLDIDRDRLAVHRQFDCRHA
jgi:phage gp46-like protein